MKEEIKKNALRRLNIIDGQVQALKKMVESEKYCVDIITQSSAIKQALSSIEDKLLENHLDEHVIAQMKEGEEDKAIREIIEIFKRAKKK